MDVSIVIVNWNAGKLLLECLQRVVQELKTVSGECIVVDNGSETGELDGVRHAYPEVCIIANARNEGFARAANQGMKKGRGRYLMLLNPDAFLTEGSLHHLITYLEGHTDVGVIGPQVTNPDGSLQGSARGFPGLLTAFFGRSSIFTHYFPHNPFSRHDVPALSSRLDEPQSVDWMSGACMVLRRRTLIEVGGFDERFFLYWEDADLCWRIRQHGWQVVYDPRVSVVHLVGVSSKQARVRTLVAFHQSAYRIYRKHVTRSAWHPLNTVAVVGLSLRALGLIGLTYLPRKSRLEDKKKKEWSSSTPALKTARTTKSPPAVSGPALSSRAVTPAMGAGIRVLRVIARLNIGGPALHASLLTEQLNPDRYKSFLVAGTEDPSEGNYLALCGRSVSTLTTVPELGREIQVWRDLVALFHLTRLIRRVRPHIVHTHTAKAGTLGRLAARLARVPVVVHTYHGHVFHGYFSPFKTWLFVIIERWLARHTDRLITVSETVRTELLALGIGTPEQLTVVRLGLDLKRFRNCSNVRGELRTELGLGPEAQLVGIVARLVPIKTHELFLKAAAQVSRRIPQSQFLVIGDGERRARLEELVDQLGLNGRVFFLGWRQDLDRIYADLDLVVLTSRNEGSPVSLIEAMAAGRAVVATRVGGVPDLVEDGVTGLLVPLENSHALVDAMSSLLEDPERRRVFGERGQKRVYPAYSAERLLGDMDQLYKDLLSSHRI